MNYLMLKNILIGILFFVLMETCFGLVNNVQLSIISFCLGTTSAKDDELKFTLRLMIVFLG